MSIKSLVGVLAFCAVVLFVINGAVVAKSVPGKAIVTTVDTWLGNSGYKIATSGSAGTKAKDMFRVMVDNLDLASGDSISLSFTGAKDTVNLGSATDPSASGGGITLTDPNSKGKVLKSSKGATVNGFAVKASYKFANATRGKASRLIVLAKGGHAGGVIEETTVNTKNVSKSIVVAVNHDDVSTGQVNNYRMNGTFQVTHTAKKDGTHNFKGICNP